MLETHSFRLDAEATSSISHVDALPSGTRLGEFEVQSLLGVGGFGMVYRAYDHSLQRAVAIKEYMPSALVSRQEGQSVMVRAPVDQQAFASGLQSFVSEARVLAQFDHPSLVKVYRFWEANNTAYMVMPLYNGITLKQARGLMEEPPPERWLRTVMWSVLQALKQLHDHNLLHRDVSPDNIFLQDVGPPVLLDLGAARRTVSEHTHKHTAVLKVNYAPIEQYAEADELKEGAWTDLYSLAAVVYGFVRNEPPLPATFRVLRDRMPNMVSVSRTIRKHFGQTYSREFAKAIDRAMAIQPIERPKSVQALINEMCLLPPENLATFDWWLELGEKSKLGRGGNSRALWDTLPRTVDFADMQRQVVHSRGGTAQRDSVWFDFENRHGDTQGRSSFMDLSDTTHGAGYARRSWLRSGMGRSLMGLAALGLVGLLGFKGLSARSPVLAGTEPAAPVVQADKAEPKAAKLAAVSHPKVRSEPDHRAGSAAVRTPAKPKPASPEIPPTVARHAPAGGELCADSGFFARPMCIYRECQKPEHVKFAVCVEERARGERERDVALAAKP